MAASSLEKTFNNLKAEAMREAAERHPESTAIITSFAEGDCFVDVLLPDNASQRYVYLPEED